MNHKSFFVPVFFIVLSALVLNIGINNAQAESGKCSGSVDYGNYDEGSGGSVFPDLKASSQEDCDKKCAEKKAGLSDSDQKYFKCGWKSEEEQKKEDQAKQEALAKATGANAGICGKASITSIMEVFKCLLLYILYFAKLILNIAFNLFKWTLDVDSLNKVMGSPVIYQIWKIVRDMLNILFILTLLFSAFATVLQIESYNYKKILRNLVIMALLVNFSFPITRFIIDVSNVIMYFFVNTLLNGGSGADNLLSSSMIGDMLSTVSVKDSLLFLIAAIVFVFIFAITILVLAVLLLIRTIALSILIIFSPIAFVGSIIPGSELAKTASKWWSSLMEYSFFGPTMVFLVYIAAKLMTIVPTNQFDDMAKNATPDDSQTALFIAAATFYVIPLVILWMGIMSAKRGSVFGSTIIVSTGMKWGGKFAKSGGGVLWGTKKASDYSGLSGSIDDRWKKFKKTGPLFGSDAIARRQAKWQSLGGGALWGDKNALRDLNRKKVNEIRKEWKDNGGASDEDIQDGLKSKDKIERMAAALEAAEKNGFKDDKRAGGLKAFEQYKNALESIKDDPAYKKLFDDKVGEKNVKLKILYDIDTHRRDASGSIMTNEQIYADHLEGMNAKKLAQQKNLHENIGTDSDLKKFMENERTNDAPNYRSFFRELSKENKKARDAYINNTMAP